ncbi:hypothetical protein POM88_052291 [Heracleum sosnowskyi]|uniref:Uncharacterized protein n=1 Tax=Heracleum sosnowskyi TaxID=360622 RepID=A0AAD8LYG8_9APIA|nr:hypothetical protein POM88_052291 [Heracleum sosnowskyi]
MKNNTSNTSCIFANGQRLSRKQGHGQTQKQELEKSPASCLVLTKKISTVYKYAFVQTIVFVCVDTVCGYVCVCRPLLVSTGLAERGIGWQRRRDFVLPVWQRPILMGEKCELPRFSGVILYDERGRPLEEHSVKGPPLIMITRTI